MSAPPHELSKPQLKRALVSSVVFMAVAWLLLTACLASIWIQGIGYVSTFTVVLLVVLVSAWAFIPVQIARYFRERGRDNTMANPRSALDAWTAFWLHTASVGGQSSSQPRC